MPFKSIKIIIISRALVFICWPLVTITGLIWLGIHHANDACIAVIDDAALGDAVGAVYAASEALTAASIHSTPPKHI